MNIENRCWVTLKNHLLIWSFFSSLWPPVIYYITLYLLGGDDDDVDEPPVAASMVNKGFTTALGRINVLYT